VSMEAGQEQATDESPTNNGTGGGDMNQQPDTNTSPDPFGMWQAMRDAMLEAWAGNMNEFANSESYARAMGLMMDTYLTTSAPYQQMTEKSVTQVLELLNMPTRADVIGLAERLTNIEMRLDDLDAKLDTLLRVARQTTSASTPSVTPTMEEC
ncbi:MAG: hypothetical protein ACRDIB_04035, partial [Ardenticatenaceae bacterium]